MHAGERDLILRRPAEIWRTRAAALPRSWATGSAASAETVELEAERSVEAQGRVENLQELVGSAREYDEQVDRGDVGGLVGIVGGAAGDDPPVGLARVQAFLFMKILSPISVPRFIYFVER